MKYARCQEHQKGTIMKNLFVVNFSENTIVASKTTLKKAGIPNSAEYKALMKLTKQHPAFEVVEKEIKKHEGKKTHKGLTEAFIKEYLSIRANAAALNNQYEKAREMGKFPLVRKWFLDTFEDFDMAAAKDEIAEAKMNKITSVAEQKTDKVSDFPVVANQ